MSHAEDAIVKQYHEHGFHRVVVRRDEANFSYPLHFHAYDLALQVIDGSLRIVTNHHHTTLAPGQHALIPAHAFHAVHTGPMGCVYVHAEKTPK